MISHARYRASYSLAETPNARSRTSGVRSPCPHSFSASTTFGIPNCSTVKTSIWLDA